MLTEAIGMSLVFVIIDVLCPNAVSDGRYRSLRLTLDLYSNILILAFVLHVFPVSFFIGPVYV